MGNGLNVERASSIDDLSEKLGIACDALREWRSDSAELAKETHMDVATVCLQLLDAGRLTTEDLLRKSPDGTPSKLQLALAAEMVDRSIGAGMFARAFEGITQDESLVRLALDGDRERFQEALQMSGGWPEKKWGKVDPNDRICIAISRPKTAALFFDRVWTIDPEIPGDIGLRTDTPGETLSLGLLDGIVDSMLESLDPDEKQADWFRAKSHELLSQPEMETLFSDLCMLQVQPQLQAMSCRNVQRILPGQSSFDAVFKSGDTPFVIAAVEGIVGVDEKTLDWEQVVEIRKDRGALLKLRKFLHWMDKDMAGKSLAYIQDELSLRVQQHRDTAQKHGLSLVWSAIRSVVTPEFVTSILGGASAMIAKGSYLPNEFANQLSAAFVGTATVHGVSMAFAGAKKHWELNSQYSDSPIAYLIDVDTKIQHDNPSTPAN